MVSSTSNSDSPPKTGLRKWIPTEGIIAGTVIRAFLPLKKNPEIVLTSSDYADLYPGDEVYVIEQTEDGKWCRGYVNNDLMPIDFLSRMGTVVEKLPKHKIQLLIFPRKCIHLDYSEPIETLDFLRFADKASHQHLQSSDSGSQKLPTLYENVTFHKASREPRPPYPFLASNSYSLNREILLSLFALTKHIYLLYSLGDFEIVEQMVDLYHELDALRIKLLCNFMTNAEKSTQIKKAIALLGRVPKFIASRGAGKHSSWSKDKTIDPSGYDAILTRDHNTAKLLTEDTSPQLMAASTLLYATSSNYPVSNMDDLKIKPDQNISFESAPPSQILVDIHKFSGSLVTAEGKRKGLFIYLYLRTGKTLLTEPFVIELNKSNIALDTISAALFNNLPNDISDNNRIYLAVEIVESLDVAFDSNEQLMKFQNPFLPFKGTAESTTGSIRRGIVAGAADISRVFSRAKGSLESGRAYSFKVELFASYYSEESTEKRVPSLDSVDPEKIAEIMKTKPLRKSENRGWGDLVDRIINDSQNGIAVTSKAEYMQISVKEIKGDGENLQLANNDSSTITSVEPQFYDTISLKQSERLYLTLGKVSLFGIDSGMTNVSNISIHITSNNEAVKFRPGSVGCPLDKWSFIGVRPGEVVNETIRIDGLEEMGKEETLRVSAYVNGYLMAKSRFYVKKGHQILEYNDNSVFQLMSTSGKPLVEIELKSVYVGKNYNMDRTIYGLISLLRKQVVLDKDFEQKVLELLKSLKVVSLTQIIKYFNPILLTLLELINVSTHKYANSCSDSLKVIAFNALVQFLDMNIVRHDSNKHLFNNFCRETEKSETKYFPQLGSTLIKLMSDHFSNAQNNWSFIGRALCRSYILILRLGKIFSDDFMGHHEAVESFFKSICAFFSLTNNSVLVDQTKILETFDLAVNQVSSIYDDSHITEITISLFEACHQKENSSHFKADEINVKKREFINAKFLLMRRILQNSDISGFLLSTENLDDISRIQLLSNMIVWSFEPFLTSDASTLDLVTARYANGVLVTIIENIKDEMFERNVIRLLPVFCRVFLLLRNACKIQDQFKFKRLVTPLFPTESPLHTYTIDSIMTEDILVEVLMEMVTIIVAISKIVERRYGSKSSIIKVISECENDEAFNSSLYVTRVVREDVNIMLKAINRMLRSDFFPSKKWHTLTSSIVRASVTTCELLADVFVKDYQPTEGMSLDDFDVKLWVKYLRQMIGLGIQKCINIVNLSPLPRKAVWLLCGDLVERVSILFSSMWHTLGTDCSGSILDTQYGVKQASMFQICLCLDSLDFVAEFCAFALHRHISARQTCTKIMWVVLALTWETEHAFTTPLNQFTPQFYNSYNKGFIRPNLLDVNTFMKTLLNTITIKPSDDAFKPIVQFTTFLKEFLASLAETEEIPSGAEFDDDRTASKLQLFGYLMSMKQPRLLHTLVNDLFINNMRKKDFVQAALSLELLALTYDWNPNDTVPASKYPPLPEQSSFERREYLYKEAARNFTKGLKLEKALIVYKDLAEAYDKINYNLDGLSYVHGQISNIYMDLQNVDRLVPSYFKVSFLGFGFPNNLRGRTFIFEGLPFEYITSIHNRLLKLYPGSKLVHSFDEAEKLLVAPPNGKYIHVISVEPRLQISDEYATSDKKNDNNNKIRLYIENRNLKTFSSSRKLGGNMGVTDLWVVEYVFETKSTFPTLMNRSEVSLVTERKLSPISNAIKSLQQKIQDLSGLEEMCYKVMKENGDTSEIFSELSRNISGTIDAPINGGIAQYREFYQNEDIKVGLEPTDVDLLVAAFNELTLIVNRCLALHGQLCPVSLVKSHTLLKDLFVKNFEVEIATCNIDINETKEEVISRIQSIQSSQQSISKRSSLLMTKSLLSSNSSIRSGGSNGSSTRASFQDLSTTYSQRTVKSAATTTPGLRMVRPTTHVSSLRGTR